MGLIGPVRPHACAGAFGSQDQSNASREHHQASSQAQATRELRETLTQVVAGQAKQQVDIEHLSRQMQALSEHLGMRSLPPAQPTRGGGLFWA